MAGAEICGGIGGLGDYKLSEVVTECWALDR
jgi:hypothetical protein